MNFASATEYAQIKGLPIDPAYWSETIKDGYMDWARSQMVGTESVASLESDLSTITRSTNPDSITMSNISQGTSSGADTITLRHPGK